MDDFVVESPLRTRRLLLRPHRREDLDDLVRFHGDAEVVRFLPWPVRNREQTATALETKLGQGRLDRAGQWLVLAVELQQTGRVIGEVLLKLASEQDRQGELGFVLARDAHGQGYASEAAHEMLRVGFESLRLHRITALCVDRNLSSAKLLTRLGMHCEGHFADDVLLDGEWASRLLFAVRAADWRSRPDDGYPRERGADREQIEQLVQHFLDAFTAGPGVGQRMDRLRAVFLPGAVVTRTCGGPVAALGIEEFLAPRRELLDSGRLRAFREWPTAGHAEVFGDIAHWFGSYAKDGTLDGQPYAGHGMKSMQFVRTPGGWRISAVAWDDERPAAASRDGSGEPPGPGARRH